MENQSPTPGSGAEFKTRWQNVLKVRREFASELESMAAELPGQRRDQLESLSRWFRGSAGYEEAIQRPDVLAICLPLVITDDPDALTATGMAHAARRGLSAVGRFQGVRQHLLRLLLYPLLILLAAMALWIGFSFWIAPEFRQMFLEFGIELPLMTKRILWLAETVQRFWWVVLILPFGVALCWFLNQMGRDRRPGNQTWLDQRWMSTRNALASWAWHVSLLLEAGFSQNEAIKTAGAATANAKLRRISFEATGSRQLDKLGQEEAFDFDPKYELLDNAIRMPNSPGKITLLREIATYYWDRNRNVGDWWVQWLVAVMLCGILVAIVITVMSLFFPLIAIISGLTSTK